MGDTALATERLNRDSRERPAFMGWWRGASERKHNQFPDSYCGAVQVRILPSPMMSVDGWQQSGNIGQKREGQTRSCFAGESTRYFGPESGSRWQCRKLRLVSWPRKCQHKGMRGCGIITSSTAEQKAKQPMAPFPVRVRTSPIPITF